MHAFRTGQRITLSASPTIQLAEYQYLKPMASITITVGDDPESDIEDAREGLQRAIYESIRVELGIRNDIQEFLAETEEIDLDTLAAFCTEKANGHEVTVEEETNGREVESPKTGKPSKKAKRRKARRRK